MGCLDYVTRDEFNQAIDQLADSIADKITTKISEKNEKPLISRQEIIRQIGRTKLDKLVNKGLLIPIRGNGRNGKMTFLRSEYKKAIKQLNK